MVWWGKVIITLLLVIWMYHLLRLMLRQEVRPGCWEQTCDHQYSPPCVFYIAGSHEGKYPPTMK
jgi:hypothetical protein